MFFRRGLLDDDSEWGGRRRESGVRAMGGLNLSPAVRRTTIRVCRGGARRGAPRRRRPARRRAASRVAAPAAAGAQRTGHDSSTGIRASRVCPCEYPPAAAAVTRPLSLRAGLVTRSVIRATLPAASPPAPSPTVVRCQCPIRLCFRLSPLTASHPQDGAGNAFAALAASAAGGRAPVWSETRHRPPLRHLGLFARPLAASRPAPAALAASPRPCPTRFRVSAECAFPSPSHRFCSPAKSTS